MSYRSKYYTGRSSKQQTVLMILLISQKGKGKRAKATAVL